MKNHPYYRVIQHHPERKLTLRPDITSWTSREIFACRYRWLSELVAKFCGGSVKQTFDLVGD